MIVFGGIERNKCVSRQRENTNTHHLHTNGLTRILNGLLSIIQF